MEIQKIRVQNEMYVQKSKTWAQNIAVFGSRCADVTRHTKTQPTKSSFCTVILVPSQVFMTGSFLSWQFWSVALWSAQCWHSGHPTLLQRSLCGIWESEVATWCRPLDNPGTATRDAMYLEVSAALGDGQSAWIYSHIQIAELMGMSYFIFSPKFRAQSSALLPGPFRLHGERFCKTSFALSQCFQNVYWISVKRDTFCWEIIERRRIMSLWH